MADFDKISEYIDEPALKKQTDFLLSEFKRIETGALNTAKSFQGFSIKLEGDAKISDLVTGLKKVNTEIDNYKKTLAGVAAEVDKLTESKKQQLKTSLDEAKAVKELAAAKLLEAKTSNEVAKGKRAESDASDKSAKSKEKEAQKAVLLKEPYRQLALQFAAAAKEAQNLGAQYGTQDKRAQAAAKTANELNNQLKKIDASIGNHQREVGNYGKALEGAKDKLKELGTAILGFVGITAGFSFLESSVDEFLELDKAMRILQNTLRNVGVPEMFDRIEHSTKNLQRQFKFLADEDIASSFNKLIVYGKLTEKQINQLLPVIIDFATASGQTLPEATTTVIKALEGNGKALKEYGINMKDAKNVTEGFSLIMNELKPKVDGVAKAFGESAAGGIASSKEQFKQLKEEVGEELIPVLLTLLGVVDKVLKGLKGVYKSITGQDNGLAKAGIDAALKDPTVIKDIKEQTQQLVDIYNSELAERKRLISEGKKFEQKTDEELFEGHIKSLEAKKAKDDEYIKKNASAAGLRAAAAQNGNTKMQQLVDEFKVALAESQAIENAIDQLSTGNKVIGGGDPNKLREKGPKNDLKKKADDELRAQFEILKIGLQQMADFNKAIADDESQSLENRLAALQRFEYAKLKIIEGQAELDKKIGVKTATELKLVDEKKADETLRLQREVSQKGYEILKNGIAAGLKLSDDEKAHLNKIGQEVIDKFKDRTDKQTELLKQLHATEVQLAEQKKELYKNLYDELTETATAFIEASTEKDIQKNNDEIAAIDTRKAKEIETIDQTVTNRAQAADQIAIIEAEAQAKKEELEERNRQLEKRKANIEKLGQAATIVGNTAQGVFSLVVKASEAKAQAALLAANPLTAAYAPIALASAAAIASQIPFVIGIGTAQLAKLVLPKFKGGLQYDYEGLGIVGDGGKREAIQRADGTIEVTPDTDTLTVIRKGDRIHSDADEFFNTLKGTAMHSVARTANKLQNAAANQIKETDPILVKMMNDTSEMKNYLKVIARKKELNLNITERGIAAMYQHGMNITKYINDQTNW